MVNNGCRVVRYQPNSNWRREYTKIENSQEVQQMLLAKATAIELRARREAAEQGARLPSERMPPYHLGGHYGNYDMALYSDVRPGLHRAHARVTAYLLRPKSYYEAGHNKKWKGRIDKLLQSALDASDKRRRR